MIWVNKAEQIFALKAPRSIIMSHKSSQRCISCSMYVVTLIEVLNISSISSVLVGRRLKENSVRKLETHLQRH